MSFIGKRSTEILTRAGIRVQPPEGAFYLFLDFSQHSKKLISKGIADSRSLCERLLDETGAIRRFVNVYVNEEDIRFLQNQDTPLNEGDEISIIPAIAGG